MKSDLKGTCVVIDVFRVSTTISCILEKKPKELYIYHNKLKKKNLIKFSEVDKSATYDNSPHRALLSKIENKYVSIQSDNGTKVLEKVKDFDEVLICCFANISAIVDYIKKKKIVDLKIVPAGRLKVKKKTIEDTLCADFLKKKLLNMDIDYQRFSTKNKKAITERLYGDFSYKIYIDLQLCTQLDWLNIVPKVKYNISNYISIFDAKTSK